MSDTVNPASRPPGNPVATPTPAAYWARVRGLLMAPTQEWRLIAAERPSLQRLFLFWVAPLVLLFFAAPQVGSIAFPPEINGVATHPSAVRALYTILVGVLFGCAGVLGFGAILDFFAPHFGGVRDRHRAIMLAAYASVALWLSGVIGLAPPLWFLSAVGLASFYTLYRGIPAMTGAPADKALPYAAASIGAGAVLGVILMSLAQCVAIVGGGSALAERRAVPPPATVQAAPAAVAAAPVRIDPAAPIDPEKLRRLLPDALPGGWIRAGLTRNAGGALGFTGPTVSAIYENSGRRIRLEAIDLGHGRAAALIAAHRIAHPERDDAAGFSRHAAETASYAYDEMTAATGNVRQLRVIADRLALHAEGSGGTTLEDLGAAIAALDPVRVDQIARGL